MLAKFRSYKSLSKNPARPFGFLFEIRSKNLLLVLIDSSFAISFLTPELGNDVIICLFLPTSRPHN